MVIDLRVREYVEYIAIARNLSPLTVNNTKHVLEKFLLLLGQRDTSEISYNDIEAWMMMQSTTLNVHGNIKKPTTINTERAVIRAFLRYCRNSGDELKFDPATILNMKSQRLTKKVLRPEQIVSVASQMTNKKLKLVILVTFYAGLRIGETIKLYPSSLEGSVLRIEDTKSLEPRPAFIPDELADELRQYIYDAGITGRIFAYGRQIPSLNYERYNTNGVRKEMQKNFAKLGYKMNPHDLRHAFATMLRRNGADVYDIKELLGHADVRTTQMYIHMEDQELQAKHKKYSIGY